MKLIADLVRYFAYITTGIVIVNVVILLITDDREISTTTLIQILCAGLITSLVTVIFYPKEQKSMKEFIWKVPLHYVVLCVVMVFFGTLFEWISFNFMGILMMVIATAAVYVFTVTVSFLTAKRDADKLNSALRDKQSKK